MADDNKKIAFNDAELEKISGGVDIEFGYEGYGTVISKPLENIHHCAYFKPRYEVKSDDGWTEVADYSGPGILEIGTRVKIGKSLGGLFITRC